MTSPRRALCLLATATLLTIAASARAQVDCSGSREDKPSLLRGTVAAGLLESAIITNAQLYGAAAMAERQVLPVLAFHEGGFVRYEIGSSFGVVRAPICVGDRVRMAKADVSGGGFSFGYRTGPLGLYFVGSGGALSVASAPGARIGSSFFGIGMAQASPIAFFYRRYDRDDGLQTLTFDAIAGAQLATDYGTLNVAYVASQGLYTNVTAAKIHAFVAAAIQPKKEALEAQVKRTASDLIDQVPYLRLGFTTMDWLVGDAVDTIGTTSLYARRLRYPSLPRASLPVEEAAKASAATSVPFTTTHWEQLGIGGLLDVSVAGAWQPNLFLHEASVAYRIGNPMPLDVMMAKAADKGRDKGEGGPDDEGGVRFVAGVVRVPTRWYYGVGGGYRLRAGVEASIPIGVGSFAARMGFNSPETLTVYPYADNVSDIYISGSYTM